MGIGSLDQLKKLNHGFTSGAAGGGGGSSTNVIFSDNMSTNPALNTHYSFVTTNGTWQNDPTGLLPTAKAWTVNFGAVNPSDDLNHPTTLTCGSGGINCTGATEFSAKQTMVFQSPAVMGPYAQMKAIYVKGTNTTCGGGFNWHAIAVFWVAPPSPPTLFMNVTNVGAAVTRTGGDAFATDGSLVGKFVYLDYNRYTVQSVTDGDHLTLTTAPPDHATATVFTPNTNMMYVQYQTGDECSGAFLTQANTVSPDLYSFDQLLTVELHGKLNTPGVADGVVELYINNKKVLSNTSAKYRDTGNNDTLGSVEYGQQLDGLHVHDLFGDTARIWSGTVSTNESGGHNIVFLTGDHGSTCGAGAVACDNFLDRQNDLSSFWNSAQVYINGAWNTCTASDATHAACTGAVGTNASVPFVRSVGGSAGMDRSITNIKLAIAPIVCTSSGCIP